MATVYSLVCWGGRTGKTVTLTIASPCVVTSTNHGLRDGTRLVFSTTGALPTGITAGTTYYAKSTAADTFNLYTNAALTSIVNTSGTQSGTHTAKSVLMGEYFAQHSGRWGSSGAERCYDSLYSWDSARTSAAKTTDVEFCELGEDFIDFMTAYTCNINVLAAAVRIETTVNGVRSPGFHNGIIGTGYTLRYSQYSGLVLLKYNITCNGFTITPSSSSSTGTGINLAKTGCFADYMILLGVSTTAGTGCFFSDKTVGIRNSLITGYGTGLIISQYMNPVYAQNNTIVKNGYGVKTQPDAASGIYGFYHNNIVVGNVNYDWITQPSKLEGADRNAGPAGTAWVTGTGTRITIATTDFADFDNNDFRPALSTSPQVDTGIDYYGITPTDIADDERPNYNNGGSEAVDVGCYEFDHGYGNHPATATISLSNIVSGSRVLITRDDTSAVLYNDVPGASLSLETGYIGNFSVVIRKASESPYYREFSAGGTTVADQTTSIKALQQLDE